MYYSYIHVYNIIVHRNCIHGIHGIYILHVPVKGSVETPVAGVSDTPHDDGCGPAEVRGW